MRVTRWMEGLEDRRLLSVSGASLLGPLPKGGTKTEETLEAGKIISKTTEKVIGSVTFHKIKNCTEVQSVTKEGSTTTTVLNYYATDKSKNIDIVGRTTTQKTGSVTKVTTTVLSPHETVFPATLTFGTTYKLSWTDDGTTITTPGKTKTVTDASIKFTVKLASAKEVSVSVPVGKASAWLLDETVATTVGKTTTNENYQVWCVPNEGVAKIVGSGKSAFTTEATSVKA